MMKRFCALVLGLLLCIGACAEGTARTAVLTADGIVRLFSVVQVFTDPEGMTCVEVEGRGCTKGELREGQMAPRFLLDAQTAEGETIPFSWASLGQESAMYVFDPDRIPTLFILYPAADRGQCAVYDPALVGFVSLPELTDPSYGEILPLLEEPLYCRALDRLIDGDTLGMSSRGDTVRALQHILNELGATLTEDGIAGEQTVRILRRLFPDAAKVDADLFLKLLRMLAERRRT